MDRRGTHEIPSLAEELLAVSGYWATLGKGQLLVPSGLWLLEIAYTPVDGSSDTGPVGILIWFSGVFF